MDLNNNSFSSKTEPSVLVIAYALPPIQVPMSPVVARLIAGLHKLGFVVDIISAHPDASSYRLQHDNSLVDYVNTNCRQLQRLRPSFGLNRFIFNHRPFMRHFPDVMGGVHESGFNAVMAAEPSSYSAVITVSPFHTVNPMMVRIKRLRPDVRWIAHFGDPWSGNPLENRWYARHWNAWREPQALRAATYITHSSVHALEMVLNNYPFLRRERTRVIPHEFDRALYPSRPKRINDKITLRFVGTLFGRRSPAPLFMALTRLLGRRFDLRGKLAIDLIGPTDRPLNSWESYEELPTGLVRQLPTVGYIDSLQLMYDADLLLMIEADVAATPFVPSKLMDYMGANTPIIGIAPPGGCHEILDRLGCLTANPYDVDAITIALEKGIDHVIRGDGSAWCLEEVRRSFDLTSGTSAFVPLIFEPVPK